MNSLIPVFIFLKRIERQSGFLGGLRTSECLPPWSFMQYLFFGANDKTVIA